MNESLLRGRLQVRILPGVTKKNQGSDGLARHPPRAPQE